MWTMKKYIVALCLLPTLSHAQFSLVSSESDGAVREFLQDVEATLPRSIKEGINKKVTVNFKNLNYKGKVVWGQVFRNPIAPKKSAAQVDLHIKLLDNIKSHDRDLAKRTLLHEVSHIYDFQDLTVGHEAELGIKKKSYTISDSPIFLSITGWDKKTFNRYKQTNQVKSRRVDLYEDKSPQETFAVNIEHFLTDPEFKCRKPSLYAYMAKSLSHSPFEDAKCELEYRLPRAIGFDGQMASQKVIDPSRLYQVHYFFAGEGSAMMSRWGHSMLRLVMCAPSRKVVDEKCLQDRAHHMILSFRADVTNFNIDYIKGLTGKYASKMFVLPMIDVIKEYTVGELRDLYSIPLRMNAVEKERLISQVLERYWGYENKYLFFTNNCADETLNLLKNVYFDKLKMVDMKVLMPSKLNGKLEKLGISDMTPFKDLEDAKKKGYFFESLTPKLERIFADLAQHDIVPAKTEIEKFLNETTVENRANLAHGITDKGIIGKLIFIEETILNRKMVSLQKEIAKVLDEQDRNENGGTLIDIYDQLDELKIKQSGLNLDRGYGIPQARDTIFEEPDFNETDAVRLKELQQAFMTEIQTTFSSGQEDLMDSAKHKQQLFEQMISRNK